MTDYAAGLNRPAFIANGRMVARRELQHGGKTYAAGQDVPRLSLPDRQVAMLWDQGWINTLPVDSAPPKGGKR